MPARLTQVQEALRKAIQELFDLFAIKVFASTQTPERLEQGALQVKVDGPRTTLFIGNETGEPVSVSDVPLLAEPPANPRPGQMFVLAKNNKSFVLLLTDTTDFESSTFSVSDGTTTITVDTGAFESSAHLGERLYEAINQSEEFKLFASDIVFDNNAQFRLVLKDQAITSDVTVTVSTTDTFISFTPEEHIFTPDRANELFIVNSTGQFLLMPSLTPVTFLTDEEGAFLTDDAGNFLVEETFNNNIPLPIVTTLPTTLATGQQVIYRDPNGVQSLWIGNADGEAWPSVGYKEYVALISQEGESAPVALVISNTLGVVTYDYSNIGDYIINHPSGAIIYPNNRGRTIISPGDPFYADFTPINATQTLLNSSEADILTNGVLAEFLITIRIYP